MADGIGNILALTTVFSNTNEDPTISHLMSLKHTVRMAALGSVNAANEYIKNTTPNGVNGGFWLDGLRRIAKAAAHAAVKYGPTIRDIADSYNNQELMRAPIESSSPIPVLNLMDKPLVQTPLQHVRDIRLSFI